MKTNSDDYKAFLEECKKEFGCSTTEAQAIAQEVLRREKRKRIKSALVIYGSCLATAFAIGGGAINKSDITGEVNYTTALIWSAVLTFVFSYLGTYIWIHYNCNHYTSDAYGIPVEKVEKIKNQVKQ